jgi:flagellar hook protein FlgE
MGYSLANGNPSIVANGTAGLEVVNIGALALQANPSTSGNLDLVERDSRRDAVAVFE